MRLPVLMSALLSSLLLSTQLFALDFKDQSAKSLGAAGAYTSIADDQSAFFANPAGISRSSGERHLFVANHFRKNLKKWNLNAGFIDGLSEDPLAFGFYFGTLHTDERELDEYILNTAFNWNHLVMVGFTNRIVNFDRALTTPEKWTFSMDFGVLAFPLDILAVGLSARNLVRTLDTLHLSRTATGGISLNLKEIRASVDVERNLTQEAWEFRMGAEYQWEGLGVLRAGYFTDKAGDNKGYSLGSSMRLYRQLSLDAGFMDQLESSVKVFSFGMNIRI